MKCACCDASIRVEVGDELYGTIVMNCSGAIYRLCTACLDFLWQQRNPAMIQRTLDDAESSLPLA
jgi:hypothetical protein